MKITEIVFIYKMTNTSIYNIQCICNNQHFDLGLLRIFYLNSIYYYSFRIISESKYIVRLCIFAWLSPPRGS